MIRTIIALGLLAYHHTTILHGQMMGKNITVYLDINL